MVSHQPPSISFAPLLERYEAFLFDAYGVLYFQSSPAPYAVELLTTLKERALPFWVVTNDASKLPATAARKYQNRGLPIEEHQVLTSGSLLSSYFEEHNLSGSACVVLGPDDAREYVRLAGGEILDPMTADEMDVLVIGDEAGFDFLATMDRVLSLLCRCLDKGKRPALLVPNPDLLYPKGHGEYGFASGTLAMMFEQALAVRYGSSVTFTRLGKPYPRIFEEAFRRSGTRKMLMVGDQIATDIRGAREFGLDAALVEQGVSHLWESVPEAWMPTWWLSSLKPTA